MVTQKPRLTKPTVFGDLNVWGEKLNENIEVQDVFNEVIVEEFEENRVELTRLEKDKLNIKDVPSVVKPAIDNYLETVVVPSIDDYLDNEKKPELDTYTNNKKQEIDTHVQNVSKVDINNHTETKKGEIASLTNSKKTELDTHTTTKQGQLDTYTTTKETQLNNYTKVKEGELTQHTSDEIDRILALGVDSLLLKIEELEEEIVRLEDEKPIFTSENGKKYRLGIDERGILYTQEVQ